MLAVSLVQRKSIHGFTVVVLRISIFKILPRKKKQKSAIVYLRNFGKENALISVNGNGYAVSLQSESRFKNSHIKSQNQHSNIIFDHVSKT